jgi:plasmid stability protein
MRGFALPQVERLFSGEVSRCHSGGGGHEPQAKCRRTYSPRARLAKLSPEVESTGRFEQKVRRRANIRARMKNRPGGQEGWPYCHIRDMAYHMKTTLNIDDTVMAHLKREAARQGRTMSEMVETALRLMLRSQRKPADLPPLPTFHSGGELVDISDRDALYRAMEDR